MRHMSALRSFRNAVELGSFAAAARKMGLSPAAISKNINDLESYLAVRLFNRTTRRMSLTEAGAIYYERVLAALDSLDDADNAISAMRGVPTGNLRISAPSAVSLELLSRAFPAFLERYPELSIDVELDDSRPDLVDGSFDIAIRACDNPEDSSLIVRKLITLTHVVCAAPGYFAHAGRPEMPKDLARHNTVQSSQTDHADAWSFRQGGQVVDVPVKGRYKVSSCLAVRDALKAGFGIGLIPSEYIRDELNAGTLETVLDDWAPNETSIFIAYPSRQYIVPKVRVFIDFMVEHFAVLESGSRRDAA